MHKIIIKYKGRTYHVAIYPNEWDKDAWDSMVSFPREEGTPSEQEFEDFQKYLEYEGFVEQALEYWYS